MDKPEILILNWTGMQPSQTPVEARAPKEKGNHSSEDLNFFFSKIIDNVHETTHSLSWSNAAGTAFVQISQQKFQESRYQLGLFLM